MVLACRKALQAPVCQFSLTADVFMCLINAIFSIDFLFSVYFIVYMGLLNYLFNAKHDAPVLRN